MIEQGGVGIVFILTIIWSIIMILAPFYWYGTWYRAKQIDLKLEETNELLKAIAGSKSTTSIQKTKPKTAPADKAPDNYILASEYAAKNNLSVEAVIDMVSEKRLNGKPINGMWYVYSEESE